MGIPQNAVTTLRIMTRKSRFQFGKYCDMTVHDVLIKNREYIAFAYYCLEPVSFTEDILDELNVTRIQKPGVDKAAFFEWRKHLGDGYTEEQKAHYRFKKYHLQRAIAKAREARVRHEVQSLSDRGKLQQKNHGR